MNVEMPELAIPRVVPDDHAIGRLAAEHLLGRGFRHLAFFQAYDAEVERGRLAGFQEAARRGGAAFHHLDFSNVPRPAGHTDAFLALTRALKKLPLPVGIMGQYDSTANQVVLACEQARLAVPEQVAVVGVDNDPISSELGLVPLTSVDSDRFGVGRSAAALLDRLMDGEPPPAEAIRIAPKGIVVRKSTDVIAVEDPQLARALQFIWRRFADPIGADDVAAAAAVSRRKLYYLFEHDLHHSVKTEIERARVNHARHLLRDTDAKLHAVAAASGFSSAVHLGRVFERTEGCSPATYRAAHR